MNEKLIKDRQRGPLDPVYNEPRVNQLITPGHANAARINQTLSSKNWRRLTAIAFSATILGFAWTSGASWIAKSTTEIMGGRIAHSDSIIETFESYASSYVYELSRGFLGNPMSNTGDIDDPAISRAILRSEIIKSYFEKAQQQVPIESEMSSLVSVTDIGPLVQELSGVSLKLWDFGITKGSFVEMEYLGKRGALNPVTNRLDGFLVVPSSYALLNETKDKTEEAEIDFLVTGWALNEQTSSPVLVFGAVHDGEFFDLALTEADRLKIYTNYGHTDLPIFLGQIPLINDAMNNSFGNYDSSTKNYAQYLGVLRDLDVDASNTSNVYPQKAVAGAISIMIDKLNATGEITDQISHVKTEYLDLSDFSNRRGLYDKMVVMQKPGTRDMLAIFPSLDENEEVQVSALFLDHQNLMSKDGKGSYAGTFILPSFKDESLSTNWAAFDGYPVVSGREAQSALMRWGVGSFRAQKSINQ